MAAPAPSPPSDRQTTLLLGGSNGTATLCAILGDRSNPRNDGHVLRVATRSSAKYLDDDAASPRAWRCTEKQHLSDVVSADFLPTRTVTHVGAPDSVFVYGDDEGGDSSNDDGEGGGGDDALSPLERAISGISAPDDGGIVDAVVLACPVSAHLSLLRRVARALYRLDAKGLLGPSTRPPILIGTLYGAGGFDWMSRVAFFAERPNDFVQWKRPLALFGLKAFPYLCKSLKAGEVNLHGRFPQLQVAVCPSDAKTRTRAKVVLDRVLQNEATGKSLEFLGLAGGAEVGGDGTAGEESMVLGEAESGAGGYSRAEAASSARSAMLIAAQTHKRIKEAKEGSTGAVAASLPPPIVTVGGQDRQLAKRSSGVPAPPVLDALLTRSLSDHADPFASLAFLACTLNSTNQILHPCILVALFGGDGPGATGADDGAITWNPRKELTPLPRFYADGAAKPLAGQLITRIAGAEMYFVIDALERLLGPRGCDPVSSLHGGEPVGRRVMNWLGNSPRELGGRSGLTEMAMREEWKRAFGRDDREGKGGGAEECDESGGGAPNLINREGMLAKFMSVGLSHNSRLNAVLSPCIVDESSKDGPDGSIRIRPNTKTRFFTDDTQHGLCIYLGLAELLGFDLERDMGKTLYVVRRLQRWMGKEFVLPEGRGRGTGAKIVGDARDVAETSAPQAFGIQSVQDLRNFLTLDVFGERHQVRVEDRLGRSRLVSRL
ncbi:hypothetical protein ACHAWF_003390 [Thalassiosira exigua]